MCGLTQEVEENVREAEAGRRKSELQKFQRSMAESMFLTYFRILKNHTPTGLLPAALEGIARWCHLINVEFMFDIVQTLLALLQRSALALAPALYCAITAFQVCEFRLNAHVCVYLSFDVFVCFV